MDLDLDAEQQATVDAVARILERTTLTAGHLANEGGHSARRCWDALSDAGFLDVLEPGKPESYLLAALAVEEAEHRAVRAPVGAAALVAPYVGLDRGDTPVALAIADGSLVRYADQARTILMLDADRVRVLSREDVDLEPVKTRMAYPIARAHARAAGRVLDGESAARLRRSWRVLLATEIASAMHSAIDAATRYVSGRQQFGRPLGTLQAVQHHLANAYVLAAGSSWLARRAAWSMDEDWWPAVAACHATASVDAVIDAVHQVVGAIGFTKEFGLWRWTMALPVLAVEMGDPETHAVAVSKIRYGTAA